jgi:hypothetical protein
MKKLMTYSLLAFVLGVPALALAATGAGFGPGCCPFCP